MNQDIDGPHELHAGTIDRILSRTINFNNSIVLATRIRSFSILKISMAIFDASLWRCKRSLFPTLPKLPLFSCSIATKLAETRESWNSAWSCAVVLDCSSPFLGPLRRQDHSRPLRALIQHGKHSFYWLQRNLLTWTLCPVPWTLCPVPCDCLVAG
jgi:hypothetical protein